MRNTALCFMLLFAATTLPETALAQTNLVTNGDFSQGSSGWTHYTLSHWSDYPKYGTASSVTCLPGQAGNPFFYIDVPMETELYIQQELSLPGEPELSFRTWGNEDPVTVKVIVVDEAGTEHVVDEYTPIAMEGRDADRMVVCTGAEPETRKVDLAEFQWQKVKLRFDATSTGVNGTMVNLDDISVTGAYPDIDATAVAARVVVAQHDGEAPFEIDPPRATLYGRTALGFKVKASGKDGKPSKGAVVKLTLGVSKAAGISEDPSRDGSSELSVTIGEDGFSGKVYLVAKDLWKQTLLSGDVTVKATCGPNQATLVWEVVDNLELVLDAYRNGIPVGAWSPWLEALVSPPVTKEKGRFFMLFVFNLVNTWEKHVVCSSYQSMVLKLFNELRHDPEKAWQLNGIDYGPIQNLTIGTWFLHFAAVIWPAGTSWMKDGKILDPWPAQKPKIYTVPEWNTLIGLPTADKTTYRPGIPEGYVPPYPLYTPHANYPETGDGASAFPAGSTHPKLMVVTESPVELLVTDRDGKRIGWLPDKGYVVEVANPGQWGAIPVPEEDGSPGKLLFLPTDEVELTVYGMEDGAFSLHIGRIEEGQDFLTWANYDEAPVKKDEVLRFNLDLAHRCQPGIGKDGRLLEPTGKCPAAPEGAGYDSVSEPDTVFSGEVLGADAAQDVVPDVATGAGSGKSGSSCDAGAGASGNPVTLLLLLLLASGLVCLRGLWKKGGGDEQERVRTGSVLGSSGLGVRDGYHR